MINTCTLHCEIVSDKYYRHLPHFCWFCNVYIVKSLKKMKEKQLLMGYAPIKGFLKHLDDASSEANYSKIMDPYKSILSNNWPNPLVDFFFFFFFLYLLTYPLNNILISVVFMQIGVF